VAGGQLDAPVACPFHVRDPLLRHDLGGERRGTLACAVGAVHVDHDPLVAPRDRLETALDQRLLVARDDDGGEPGAHPSTTLCQSAMTSTRHAAPPMSRANAT